MTIVSAPLVAVGSAQFLSWLWYLPHQDGSSELRYIRCQADGAWSRVPLALSETQTLIALGNTAALAIQKLARPHV